MAGAINLYGDQRIATSTGHGIDVASQRADDLDLLAIEQIKTLANGMRNAIVLDAGCGFGGQSARMAKAGANVLAIDIEDYQAQIVESMQREGIESNVVFRRLSVEDKAHIGPFDIILCQRMLHYLPYAAALDTLRWFHREAISDARLFISASGMDSELGNGYAGASAPIHTRFSTLEVGMAEKHSIHPPVCLYRMEEFEAVVAEAGWCVEKAFLSAFGNVKLIARRGA